MLGHHDGSGRLVDREQAVPVSVGDQAESEPLAARTSTDVMGRPSTHSSTSGRGPARRTCLRLDPTARALPRRMTTQQS